MFDYKINVKIIGKNLNNLVEFHYINSLVKLHIYSKIYGSRSNNFEVTAK